MKNDGTSFSTSKYGGSYCNNGGNFKRKPSPNNGQNPSSRFAIHHSNTNVGITLRSEDDPVVKAEAITDGRMNFGETTEQEISTAVILMSIGGVLCIPWCIVFYMWCPCCKRDRSRSNYDSMPAADGYYSQGRGSYPPGQAVLPQSGKSSGAFYSASAPPAPPPAYDACK